MSFFKKLYCRIFQFCFKLALPFLPYRQPKVLADYNQFVDILKQKNLSSILLVTDLGIKNLGLCNEFVEVVKKNNIKLAIFDKTVPNPTSDNVEECLRVYNQNNCQALVAIGGGSVMDCAKATGARVVRPNKPLKKLKGLLKVRKKLPPFLAIPTTAGTGSETTLASVITDSQTRHKYVINDFNLIPQYTILDEKLTVGLPKHITSTTGMDALTHAVEAYIGNTTTKQTRTCAIYAIKTIFENLEIAYNHPQNIQARKNMLLSSYNAGVAFTKSYVGYVHAIAHSLGGKYNVPHGLANAIILPYVLKAYGKKVHKKLWKLGVLCNLFDSSTSKQEGAKLFIEKIQNLNQNMQIPNYVESLNVDDIEQLAESADQEANPLYPVPNLFGKEQLKQIYLKLINKGEKQ